MKIYNQLTEEYKTTYMEELLEAKKNCGEDSVCSECPFGQIEDRCILAELQIEHTNDWITVEQGLPEDKQEVIITFKNSAGLHVGEAIYQNKMFFYVTDTEFGYYEEVYKQPIAWKHKDTPYQPKGE